MIKTNEKKVNTTADSSYKLKQLVIMSLVAAIAYVVTFVCRLPIMPSAPFLDLEFKSAIILIGAYIFGPLSGLIMTAVVCLIEMVTFSTTEIIGFIMNFIATTCLVVPASYAYKKKSSTVSVVVGLIIGGIIMTVAMVAWNYFITPLYMGVPREAIAAMLVPVFVPFNLIKAGLNGGAALFLFHFVIAALKKARLIPERNTENNGGIVVAVIIAALTIATCVLAVLMINGVF